MEIITTHMNSDFDSLGAMVGARKLYPEAIPVFPGSTESTVRRFFLEASGYAAGFLKPRDVDISQVTKLIVVDTNDADRLGPFTELVGRAGVEIHLYDHHGSHPDTIPATVRHMEETGAATTILAEEIEERGLALNPEEATMMLLGIFEDTGGLTFTTTTRRDFNASGFLLAQGADLTVVREFITPELTAAQVELLDQLLKNRTTRRVFGVEITLSHATTSEYVGDLGMLAHKMADMDQVGALVVYASMGDRIHIVCRSRVAQFDGSVVARHFGGGGHPQAASASVVNLTPIDLLAELEQVLPLAVKPLLTARDLMSAPVKTIEPEKTLLEAREALNRYHVNALVVLKSDTPVGVITRQVVERGLSHGLDRAATGEYMTGDFASLGPDAPLEKVRDTIVGLRQRLVPVMEDGKLLGVVTRTDLLNALSPAYSKKEGQPDGVQVKNVRRLLEEAVEQPLLNKLKEVGATAQKSGMAAYLVGGMVRDIVMRRKNLDIDLVVEGDAETLSRELAVKWGASVHPHPAFATAKIKFPDGVVFDVASARTEFYEKPAALPVVEQSSLKLDLSRRDFTINALAMRLEPERFGEVIDFFGGLGDIKDKTIRILHNLSFVEDPTRVLRGLRFARRLGFTLGPQTRKLMRSAVAEGFLARARGVRLFRELKQALEEADAQNSMALLDQEGILKGLHPGLHFNERVRQRFGAIQEVASWYRLLYLDTPLELWKLYLLALLEPLSQEEVEGFLADFQLTEVDGRGLQTSRHEVNALLATLRHALREKRGSDSAIYLACRGLPEEVLLYSMARTGDEAKRRMISRYHTTLKNVRPLTTGSDLVRLSIPPGPLYRGLLEDLTLARLNGEVVTREDEERRVLAKWRGIAEGNESPPKS